MIGALLILAAAIAILGRGPWHARAAHGVAGLFGLFESSSSSSSSSSTTNIDKRLVNEGAGAVNISGDSAKVDLTYTDAGAVHEAFGFASATLDKTIAQSGDAVSAAQEAFARSTSALKDAYTEAKTGEQKVLVVGALIIGASLVALVAYRLTARGHA